MEQPRMIHTFNKVTHTTIHNGAVFKTAAVIGLGAYLGYSLGKYLVSLIDVVAERAATKTVDKIYERKNSKN